jgi:hypothetical protein
MEMYKVTIDETVIMATPITPTPVLEGEEAANFLRMLLKDQDVKVPLKKLPKLEKVRKQIREDAIKNEK